MLREKELALLENLKTDNEKKTEEIRQLRNNQLIGQASGEETATITDGALAFANILEETEIAVAGKKRKAYVVKLPQGLSKQTTRNGYNKLKLDADNTTINNVTFTNYNNGIFELNGIASLGTKIDLSKEIIEIEENQNYTITIKQIGGSINFLHEKASFVFILYPVDSSVGNEVFLYNSETKITKKFSTSASEKPYIWLGFSDGEGAFIEFKNAKYQIQIEKGDVQHDFEQYGSSPSTLFPSEIENFSANPNNLYNSENNASGWLDESGAIHSSISSQVTDFIEIDENNFYFMKFNNNSLSAITERIYNIYNASKTILKSLKYNPTKDTKISIPCIKDAKYLRATFDIKMTDIVIAEEKRLIELNKNILPIAYNKGQHIDSTTGIDIDFIEKNRIKLNGTATSNLNLNIINGNVFKWKKGKTYSLQLKIIEGSYDKQPLFLHTGFKNDFKDVYNNLQADISNGFKSTITIDEEGYSNKCLVYAKAGIIFNNLVIEVQLEENTTATDIVIPESEEHSLRLGNIQLNGLDGARDSLVIELANENMSDKKIKKLYYSKKYIEKVFTGEANSDNQILAKHSSIYSETRGFFQIKLENKKNSINSILAKDYMKSNYMKVVDNNGAQNTFNNNTEGLWNEGNSIFAYLILPFTTVIDSNNWLKELNMAGKPLKILYPLETPELVDITDNIELVKDVEYLINNVKTFEETTHVELQNGYIDLEYIKSTQSAVNNLQKQIDNINVLMLEGGTGNA